MVLNMDQKTRMDSKTKEAPAPEDQLDVNAQLQCSKKYLLSMLEDVPENNVLGLNIFNGSHSKNYSEQNGDKSLSQSKVSKISDVPLVSSSDMQNNLKLNQSPQNNSVNLNEMKSIDNVQEPSKEQTTPSAWSTSGPYELNKFRRMGRRCNCRLSERSHKFHCNEFSELDRQLLFNLFWKNMSWQERKTLISDLVRCTIPSARRKDCRDPHRKELTFQYHLKKNERILRVCKVMFINTFSIGEFSVRDWALNKIVVTQTQ